MKIPKQVQAIGRMAGTTARGNIESGMSWSNVQPSECCQAGNCSQCCPCGCGCISDSSNPANCSCFCSPCANS